MPLTQLREEVCYANRMLPLTGLVTMHSGNASGLDRQSGRLVIKPSGVDYDALTPAMLVEVDLQTGEMIGSALRPSVDLPHHLFLYRNMSGVGGIIHTHSNYATAMAALGRCIPVCLTAIADQFGAEIPCAPTWITSAITSARRSSSAATARRRSSWAITASSPGGPAPGRRSRRPS